MFVYGREEIILEWMEPCLCVVVVVVVVVVRGWEYEL